MVEKLGLKVILSIFAVIFIILAFAVLQSLITYNIALSYQDKLSLESSAYDKCPYDLIDYIEDCDSIICYLGENHRDGGIMLSLERASDHCIFSVSTVSYEYLLKPYFDFYDSVLSTIIIHEFLFRSDDLIEFYEGSEKYLPDNYDVVGDDLTTINYGSRINYTYSGYIFSDLTKFIYGDGKDLDLFAEDPIENYLYGDDSYFLTGILDCQNLNFSDDEKLSLGSTNFIDLFIDTEITLSISYLEEGNYTENLCGPFFKSNNQLLSCPSMDEESRVSIFRRIAERFLGLDRNYLLFTQSADNYLSGLALEFSDYCELSEV